jgi:methionyl-tRNA formyltransferase
MRAAVLTSTALRHQYFLQTIAGAFDVCAALHQAKGSAYGALREQSPTVAQHFRRIAEAEEAEFGPVVKDANATLRTVADINDPVLMQRVRDAGVEVVLLFGTAILATPWLNTFPNRIVNLHLGLAPFYRGSATLFWPFVNGELECVGATIHLAVQKVDAGAILARIKADPLPGDQYYNLTTRLIRRAIEAVPDTARRYLRGEIAPIPQEFSATRAYRKTDFDEAALTKALTFVGDGLTVKQIEAARQGGRCVC